jgi:uncharacterized protein (DUF2126 family)
MTPDRTPPVVTNNDMIAQFIPCVAAEFGSPKQVEQAYKDPARKMINKNMVLINGIIIFF